MGTWGRETRWQWAHGEERRGGCGHSGKRDEVAVGTRGRDADGRGHSKERGEQQVQCLASLC